MLLSRAQNERMLALEENMLNTGSNYFKKKLKLRFCTSDPLLVLTDQF